MHKIFSLLAAAGLGAALVAIATPAPAQATNPPSLCDAAVVLDQQAMADGFLLSVAVNGSFQPQAAAAYAASAAAPSDMRPVIVDGIAMLLPEAVIAGQIANGTFIVVYAGTSVEVPNENLPCWVTYDC